MLGPGYLFYTPVYRSFSARTAIIIFCQVQTTRTDDISTALIHRQCLRNNDVRLGRCAVEKHANRDCTQVTSTGKYLNGVCVAHYIFLSPVFSQTLDIFFPFRFVSMPFDALPAARRRSRASGLSTSGLRTPFQS